MLKQTGFRAGSFSNYGEQPRVVLKVTLNHEIDWRRSVQDYDFNCCNAIEMAEYQNHLFSLQYIRYRHWQHEIAAHMN